MSGWDAPESKLRGHTAGHFLSALALAIQAATDETLKINLSQKLEYIVQEMWLVQDSMHKEGLSNYGFFSAYSEEQFDLLEEYTTYPNIWAPYYTLHKLIAGLLDSYEYQGLKQALDIVTKLMSWLDRRFSKLSPQTIQNMWSMYIAGEYGGMNDVVVRYIDLSGDKTKIALAKAFDNEKLFYPLERNIDAINTMHANQHIPQVIGALRLYEASGEARYYNIAKNFWDIATKNHIYSIGGIGEGEMFRPSATTSQYLTDKTAEGCASYNMLKLTKMLFRHEPNVQQMDYYERTMLNHIAASLETDVPSGGSTYFMPLAPGSVLGYDRSENSCCHGTGLENHVRNQEAFYYFEEGTASKKDCLYVNLFHKNAIEWQDKGIFIKQTVDFIQEQRAVFVIGEDRALDIKLRIPSWLKKEASIRVNGRSISGAKPGTYLSLDREWLKGDTIEVELPFELSFEATIDQADLVSITYGPLVMSALSDSFDYLLLPAVEAFKKEIYFTGKTSFSYKDIEFRCHYESDGSPYHIYFRIEA